MIPLIHIFNFSSESLKIADEYHDLDLKKVCEKTIRRGITVENVAGLFSWALKLNAEVVEVDRFWKMVCPTAAYL